MSAGVLFLHQISGDYSSVGSNTAVPGQKAEILPLFVPRSAGLLAGICWKKCQSPHYSPWIGGPWLQLTDALSLSIGNMYRLSQKSLMLIKRH